MKSILKLLCVVLLTFPLDKLSAQDVLPSFNKWVHDNTSSEMKFYQIQDGTLAVATARANSNLYQIRKKSRLFFWSNNGNEVATFPHTYYRLFSKANEPASKKTNVFSIMPDDPKCEAEIKLRFNKDKTISLRHGNLTITLTRNKNIRKADYLYFHLTKPALHKSFWKLNNHQYIVTIHDPTDPQNLAILQGETDFIETVTLNLITKINDDCYQIKTENTEFLFYPGRRLKIVSPGKKKKSLLLLPRKRQTQLVLDLVGSIYPEAVQVYGYHPCNLFSQSGRILLQSHRSAYELDQALN